MTRRMIIAIVTVAILPVLVLAALVVMIQTGYADWLKYLQGWQSGLAALFGLSGIALTQFMSAKSAIDRDDRLRLENAKALATELLAEFGSLKGRLSEQGRLIKLSSLIPNRRSELLNDIHSIPTPVHDKSIGQLGILGPTLVLQVESLSKVIGFAEGCLATARQIDRIEEAYESEFSKLQNVINANPNQQQVQQAQATISSARQALSQHKKVNAFQSYIDGAADGYEMAEKTLTLVVALLADFTGVDREHRLIQ